MSVLIEELKKDHIEIVDLLKEVKELGILSKEGQAKLLSAKRICLNISIRKTSNFIQFSEKKRKKMSNCRTH